MGFGVVIFNLKAMIRISTLIFIVVTVVFVMWFFRDLFMPANGIITKKKGEIGCEGIFAIILWILYTLIWGGIFWW
jgi:hypothetical protein